MNDAEQWIRLTDGCPNQCEYCYCPADLQNYGIPEIERNIVKILDMNLLVQPDSVKILTEFSFKKVNCKVVYYELVCGIDWRFLTQEKANLLKKARFRNIRLAWDGDLFQQYRIKDSLKMLLIAGYRPRDLTLFMICNWKISFNDCMRKLDICKVWNVKVADCWYDNQLSPNIRPIYWTSEEIRSFRKSVRKHNQIVNFGLDPELKKEVAR